MKAVKLYNIKWDLEGLSPEEKKEAEKNLPTQKGFVVDDDFNVLEKVPVLLKKKFGYDFITYSISEIKIIENFEDLLYHCAEKGENPKPLFKVSGELSGFGRECYNRLKHYIHRRIKLENQGTDPYEMPKILDEVMLALEKITGIDWDKNLTEEEWYAEIDKILNGYVEDFIADKEKMKEMRRAARKAAKEAAKEKGEDEEDDDDDDEEE